MSNIVVVDVVVLLDDVCPLRPLELQQIFLFALLSSVVCTHIEYVCACMSASRVCVCLLARLLLLLLFLPCSYSCPAAAAPDVCICLLANM